MGGNALKIGLTEKKLFLNYFQIKNEIIQIIKQTKQNLFILNDLYNIPNKLEYGDLDLIYYRLYDSNNNIISYNQIINYIQSHFQPNEIKHISNIISFDYKKFQIDFIECNEYNMNLTKFCLSYSDRGMILGQIARWYGFSLGLNGLIIVSEDIEKIIGYKGLTEKIVLSLDPLEIRQFMGLPLNDDMILSRNDVGLFCKLSPWFRPEQFTNKLNSDGRKRWAKRPYYRYFVEQIIAEVNYHYNYLISQNETISDNHLRNYIHSSFEIKEFEELNPLHSDYNYYTITSYNDHQIIRETYIRSALDYFNKWNEVELIKQKYDQLHEMKDKLNYNFFINLGISSDMLSISRLDFLTWLSRNNIEITEENRKYHEKELLSNETSESIQEKLNEWYQSKQEST